jgi:hypothetical protein
MNKKLLFFPFVGVLLLSLFLPIPVLALSSNWGWSTLPMTDPANDVFQYNISAGEDPWDGIKGAFHPEIDILRVSLVGVNISIEFAAPPSLAVFHGYSIYIDLNNDGNSEYIVATFSYTVLYLKRESDGKYWNGTGWGDPINIAFVSGNNLTITELDLAIPFSFSIAKYAVTASYSGDNPIIYKDFAPLDPSPGSGGIPGFAWIFVCFGLIALLGIVLIQKHRLPPL